MSNYASFRKQAVDENAKTKKDKNYLPKFPWLSFVDEQSLDAQIATLLKSIIEIPPYDCYQVEDLIADVSGALDRCLTYRKEYNDIEATAIRAAMDSDLFTATVDGNKELELNVKIEQQRAIEGASQRQAAVQFGVGATPMEKGFSCSANGNAQSLDVAVEIEQRRKILVEAKWSALENYQQLLVSRYNTPGHPLNFADRANKVRRFLFEEISDAYQKIRCIEKGLLLVFNNRSPIPDIENPTDVGNVALPRLEKPAILDALVFWLRSVMRDLEIRKWSELTFEHVVYGCQSAHRKDGENYRLISLDEFARHVNEAGSDGKLKFDLSTYFDPDLGKLDDLRVLGVGLSVSFTKEMQEDRRLMRIGAVVFPPDVPNPFDPNSVVKRSPIIIENVPYTDPFQRTKLLFPPSAANIDPRGIWAVQLSSNLGFPDNLDRERLSYIADVKLHLQLAGRPSPDSDDWVAFWW